MPEIELKFILDGPSERRLVSRLRTLTSARRSRKKLRSIYFDTDSLTLKNAGLALRLRNNGKSWIQTVKSGRGPHIGLSQVEEVESPIVGQSPQIQEISNQPLRTRVAGLVGDCELRPICETRITRIAYDIELDGGSKAELAIDKGNIVADDRSAEIHEVEIELLEGKTSDLFELARLLLPGCGFQFSRYSKGARGYMLAREGYTEPPLAPRFARAVELENVDLQSAACKILRECLDQITANLEVVRKQDDPEGPHQLRVGLRRLRAACTAFEPIIGGAELDSLMKEAKWMGRTAGSIRDLEVLRDDIVSPENADAQVDLGPALLRTQQLITSARKKAIKALNGERGVAFILALAKFIETRGWLAAYNSAEQPGGSLGDLSRSALDKSWKSVRRKAKGIAKLDVEGRHALRKELKQLRYVCEFFLPLYRQQDAKPFLSRLKKLQNCFGYLNDIATLQAHGDLLEGGAVQKLAIARAIGYLLGINHLRAGESWGNARTLWRDLQRSQPFWS